MGKKRAAPIMPPIGHLTARDRIWTAIRAAGTFTRQDLQYATEATPDTIRHYVMSLTAAGFLQPCGIAREQRPTWRLVRDTGVDAPRVNRKGTILPPSGRDRMWAAIKPLGGFDAPMLAMLSGAAEKEAKAYIGALLRAGYLRVVKAGGSSMGVAQYRLLPSRDTGPQAPAIRRNGAVYDLNLDRQVWPAPPAPEVAHG